MDDLRNNNMLQAIQLEQQNHKIEQFNKSLKRKSSESPEENIQTKIFRSSDTLSFGMTPNRQTSQPPQPPIRQTFPPPQTPNWQTSPPPQPGQNVPQSCPICNETLNEPLAVHYETKHCFISLS